MAISAEIRCIHLVSLFLMKLFMLGLHLDICVCLCSVTNLESRGEHSTVQGFLHLQFCLLKRILSYLCIFCITSAVGYNLISLPYGKSSQIFSEDASSQDSLCFTQVPNSPYSNFNFITSSFT